MILADGWLSASTYYILSILLIALCLAAWSVNFLALPGNWLIVGVAALFAWLMPKSDHDGVLWRTVFFVILLALFGELIELAMGIIGAKKYGGSRRGVVLGMAGAMIGSIIGATAGIPVPVLGPLIGAVGGAGLGAFAGAYLGESWKGRRQHETLAISTAAMVGRVLGTMGKLLVGLVMLVIIAVDLFVN